MNTTNQNQNQNPAKVWIVEDCFDVDIERHNKIIEKGYEPFAAIISPMPQQSSLIAGGKQQMGVGLRIYFKRQVEWSEWLEIKKVREEIAAEMKR